MVDAEEKMLFRGFLWQMCQNIGVGGMGGCGRTGGVRGRVGVGERVGVGGRVHGCVQHIKMGPAAEVLCYRNITSRRPSSLSPSFSLTSLFLSNLHRRYLSVCQSPHREQQGRVFSQTSAMEDFFKR